MPFKTRRQKEAAASRRFVQTNSVLVNYQASPSPKKQVDIDPGNKIKQEDSIEKLNYVGSDIAKILLLAILIAGAQIILALTRA